MTAETRTVTVTVDLDDGNGPMTAKLPVGGVQGQIWPDVRAVLREAGDAFYWYLRCEVKSGD